MRPVVEWVEVLLDNYKVLTYNGQLDFILGVPLAEKLYRNYQWSGREEFLAAQKQVWTVGNLPAGYVRTAKNYTQLAMRNAGHLYVFTIFLV